LIAIMTVDHIFCVVIHLKMQPSPERRGDLLPGNDREGLV
jgi:hypothetical protein